MKIGTRKQPKRIRTTIAIDEDVWERGKILAAQDRRNFSSQIEILILAEAKRRNGKEAAA